MKYFLIKHGDNPSMLIAANKMDEAKDIYMANNPKMSLVEKAYLKPKEVPMPKPGFILFI